MIGITGGIGSGKSTIAQALAQRGYTVYDCDREAKRMIAEDAELRQAITALLGEEAFVGGQYNTAYVAKRVFTQPELLTRLNAIVHPAVRKDIMRAQPDFIESAILYEAGLNRLCDKMIVVDAPEEVRLARTIARDYQGDAGEENINKVRARMRAQHIPAGEGFRVNNDGKTAIEEIVNQILSYYEK